MLYRIIATVTHRSPGDEASPSGYSTTFGLPTFYLQAASVLHAERLSRAMVFGLDPKAEVSICVACMAKVREQLEQLMS